MATHKKSWYPISFVGGLVTGESALAGPVVDGEQHDGDEEPDGGEEFLAHNGPFFA